MEIDIHDSERTDLWKNKMKERDSHQVKFRCTGGVSKLFIDAFGKATICGFYRHNGVSVTEQGFDTAWNHLQEEHRRLDDTYNNSACATCQTNSLCRWCPAYALVENQNTKAEPVTYFCELAHNRVRQFS